MTGAIKAALATLTFSISFCALAASAQADGIGGTYPQGQQEDARNALTRCMLASFDKADQDTMVRWVYIVISLNPAVQGMGKVTDKDVDQANADMAAMFMRLVTVACRKEAKRAVRAHPEDPFGPSFNALGQEAGSKLLEGSGSARIMQGFEKHLDAEKIEQLSE